MLKIIAAVILGVALVEPPALFSYLVSHGRMDVIAAAAVAIAMGWTLSIAWAFTTDRATAGESSKPGGENLRIAMRLGWICPAVLVLLVWLVRYFTNAG